MGHCLLHYAGTQKEKQAFETLSPPPPPLQKALNSSKRVALYPGQYKITLVVSSSTFKKSMLIDISIYSVLDGIWLAVELVLDTEYTDQAVITAGGKSSHIPALWVSPSMKWLKHTKYFSFQWLLKEKPPFQSYDILLGQHAGLTIIKLEKKLKGEAETITSQIESCRTLWDQPENEKGNCKAALENAAEVILH